MSFTKLSDTATTPTKGSEFAAGYDLYSSRAMTLAPGETALVPTDIAIALPYGIYGRIAPRSGLAYKKKIWVNAGVCDADYRNGYGVVMLNAGDEPFEINVGDRIAQVIFEQHSTLELKEVAELPATTRGLDGFGSTGV